MINATNIIETLAEEVAPSLGTGLIAEHRLLEALTVKIEYRGVVDELVIKSIYFVPSGDDTEAALHIEVMDHDDPRLDPEPEHGGPSGERAMYGS